MGKQHANYVVLDFETGGLKPETHGITEIACCPMDCNLNDLPEFNKLVKPHDNWVYEQKALDMSIKMTLPELTARGEESEVVFNEFVKYISKLKVKSIKPIMCGHNFDAFDSGFLASWFAFFKKDLSKYINVNTTMDTLNIARWKWVENIPNYKLGTCCQQAGIDLTDAHRALPDTRANKELLRYFLLSLRSQGGGQETQKRFRHTFKI